jgi:hypothetical protein
MFDCLFSKGRLRRVNVDHDSALMKRSFFSFSTSGLLSLDSTHSFGNEDRGLSVTDVVLGGSTDHERRDVDHLFANGNMSLSDENTSMMNRLGEVLLVADNSLQSTLQELIEGQTKDVIESSLIFLEEAKLHDSSDEGVTFEESFGISLVEGKELSGSLSELSESKLNAPNLTLVPETELTNGHQLSSESILIERLPGSLGCFLVVSIFLWHFNKPFIDI